MTETQRGGGQTPLQIGAGRVGELVRMVGVRRIAVKQTLDKRFLYTLPSEVVFHDIVLCFT